MCIADVHTPYHNKKVLDIFLKIKKDIKPDWIVFLWDAFDAEWISKYTIKSVETWALEVINEIRQFKKEVFEPLTKWVNKVYWTLWNHEDRLNTLYRFLEGKWEKLLLWAIKEKTNLRKIFPNVMFCEYNQSIKIGKLYFTHWTYCNDLHAKKMVDVYWGSIMYGHLHTTQVYTKVNRAEGKAIQGISIPCACDMNPAYLKNAPTKWVNWFAVVNFTKSWDFSYQIVQVINLKTIFNWRLYS